MSDRMVNFNSKLYRSKHALNTAQANVVNFNFLVFFFVMLLCVSFLANSFLMMVVHAIKHTKRVKKKTTVWDKWERKRRIHSLTHANLNAGMSIVIWASQAYHLPFIGVCVFVCIMCVSTNICQFTQRDWQTNTKRKRNETKQNITNQTTVQK